MSVDQRPEIENLLAEGRTFPPDPAFAAQANATADAVRGGGARLRGVLGEARARDGSAGSKPFDTTLEWDLPFAKWFVGGKLNVSLQLRRPARRERPRRQGRLPLDRRARRHPDDHLRRPPARGPEGRQRAPGAGRRDRRPGRDLHADDPRAADRDARLRPDRRAAHGRLRRVLGRGAVAAGSTTARRSSSSPPTAAGGAARRSPLKPAVDEAVAATPDDRARPRGPPPRRRALDTTVAEGRDVWWHDIVDRQSEDCPPVAGRLRAHALPALHVGHDGQAEGHPPHDRRLPRSARRYTHEMIFDIKPDDVYWCAADIGWVTGHSYIVYGPLANATTGVHVRGHARHAGLGPLVADHRGLQGHDPVLRPDRDPGVHEAGRRSTRRSTTCRRCACSARSASRSTPRPGSGTASTSAAARRRSSTRGGRPRPARS